MTLGYGSVIGKFPIGESGGVLGTAGVAFVASTVPPLR